MSRMSASVRASPGAPSVGWTGARTVTIDRSVAAGGMGLGFNGGELLLLALGACYTNDVYREAKKRGIEVRSIAVEVSAEFPKEGAGAEDVRYDVRVEADATAEAIRDLLEATDSVAEIHNTLRAATPVRLGKVEAVSTGAGP